MIPTLQDVRRQNLQKATQVRQSEFRTLIHALPPKIKARIDYYLKARFSPRRVLAEVCYEFPNADLPSPKTLENYRNKYFSRALTTYRALRKNYIRTEFTTLRTKSYIAQNIIPRLLDRINLLLEKENSIGVPLNSTNVAVSGLIKLLKQLEQ